jgi:hypothetical protein
VTYIVEWPRVPPHGDAVAHHEAGHAVAAVLLRLPLPRVVADVSWERPAYAHTGSGMLDAARAPRELLVWHAVVACAGPAAEARYLGLRSQDAVGETGYAADVDRTRSMAARAVVLGDGDSERWEADRVYEARRLVSGAWHAVQAVARGLSDGAGPQPAGVVRSLVYGALLPLREDARLPRLRLPRRLVRGEPFVRFPEWW